MFHDHDGRAIKPEDLFLSGYPVGDFERGILNPTELLNLVFDGAVDFKDLSAVALRSVYKAGFRKPLSLYGGDVLMIYRDASVLQLVGQRLQKFGSRREDR